MFFRLGFDLPRLRLVRARSLFSPLPDLFLDFSNGGFLVAERIFYSRNGRAIIWSLEDFLAQLELELSARIQDLLRGKIKVRVCARDHHPVCPENLGDVMPVRRVFLVAVHTA